MNERSLLARLGLGADPSDARLALAIVLAGILVYAAGYAAFYPTGATVDDEALYLGQTQLLIETGSVTAEKIDPLTDQRETFSPGDYPFGTVALMAPFAAAFGPRGAFLASFFSLVFAVWLTARWLVHEKRSPLFALILLAFPAAIVGGRLAMSDTARMAATALGLLLFFRGLDAQRARYWLASGLVAGLSLTLRESAVLPFVPAFAGAVLRRDRGWSWLLLGGLAGTAVALLVNYAAFGDPLYTRRGGYLASLATIHERLPLYLFALLVLVPGGLWFAFTYRGRRRAELIATVLLFLAFYLGQAYGMAETGFAKRLVLGLRYFDPLLPILAVAMAESFPRQLGALLRSLPERRRVEQFASAAIVLWIAGTLLSAFAVHPALSRWAASQARIRASIGEHVPRDAVLVINGTALRKFVDDLTRPYETLWRDAVSDGEASELLERHGGYVVALLDRSDSEYWRRDAENNQRFVEQRELGEPVVDARVTSTDRLRIWYVGEPRALTSR
jgi:4-amino-4-deoxy-L-arabinose transferase-like glycosyltransferase